MAVKDGAEGPGHKGIMTIQQRARKIRMLILDVDGVMTDGKIIYDNRGRELKCFSVLDGMGFVLLGKAAIKVALITAKASAALRRRARDIGAVELKENSIDKLTAFRNILRRHRLKREEICFMGDDLIDMPVMRRVGLAVAVANAAREAKGVAHYITTREGGRGAVREVAELILRSQHKWHKIIGRYLI